MTLKIKKIDVIKQVNFPLNLALLYNLVKIDFITAQSCCVLLNERLSNSENENEIDFLVELNLSEDNKYEFLDIFKEYIYNNTSLDIEYYFELGTEVYALINFIYIKDLNCEVSEKLDYIQFLWFDFGFDGKWNGFVGYSSPKDGNYYEDYPITDIDMYNNFLNYVEKKSKKLKELIKEAW